MIKHIYKHSINYFTKADVNIHSACTLSTIENVTFVLTWNSQVAQDFSWPQSSLKHWFPGIAASLPLEEVHAAFTAKGQGWSTSSVWKDLSTYNTLQLAVQQLFNQQMKRATLISREKLINVLQLRTIAQINKTWVTIIALFFLLEHT